MYRFIKVIFQVKTIHSSSVSILMGATMDLQGKKYSLVEALGNALAQIFLQKDLLLNIVDGPSSSCCSFGPINAFTLKSFFS